MLLHSRLRLGFLFALIVFCIVLTGKSFAQDSELSANEIIQILQENPDVLAEAKTEIVNQLRDRGYNVSERDITDDRLFSQIRSDDRVRQLAANELAKRGFGPAQESEQAARRADCPNRSRNKASKTISRLASKTARAISRHISRTRHRPGTAGRQGTQNGQQRQRKSQTDKAPSQEQYPLRNLPALRDLYTQATVDETKLERFGAALFRNSAAVADKSHFERSSWPGLCSWSRR